jgi:hypothetical protein
MDLRETGWGSVEWIQLAQDRDRWRALVNTVMNLRVLSELVSSIYGKKGRLITFFCFILLPFSVFYYNFMFC